MSQSRPKLLGPEPRSPPWESTFFEIHKVAERDGRTSIFSTLKVLDTTSPSVPEVAEMEGLMRKMREMTPRTTGKKIGLRRKFLDASGRVAAGLKKCFSIFKKKKKRKMEAPKVKIKAVEKLMMTSSAVESAKMP